MQTHTERDRLLEFLASYREYGQQLLQALGEAKAAQDDELDLERIDSLLAERDQLIATCPPLTDEGRSDPLVRAQLIELQRVDQQVVSDLDTVRQRVQGKMQALQSRKRGANAYDGRTVSTGGSFIDRKE